MDFVGFLNAVFVGEWLFAPFQTFLRALLQEPSHIWYLFFPLRWVHSTTLLAGFRAPAVTTGLLSQSSFVHYLEILEKRGFKWPKPTIYLASSKHNHLVFHYISIHYILRKTVFLLHVLVYILCTFLHETLLTICDKTEKTAALIPFL